MILSRTATAGLLLAATTAALLVASPPPADAAPALYLPYRNGTTHQVTQGNNSAYSHRGTYGSYAVDFAMAVGTDVVASAPGTVLRRVGGCHPTTRNDGCNSGLGNYMDVRHSDGTCTRYSHLASFVVGDNASVAGGQHIAESGNSGWSTGPHLDWRATRCDSVSVPAKFVEYAGSYADRDITGRNLTSRNGAAAPAPSYVGKIVRNSANGACYLVKANNRRYWIPSGGDLQAMQNNGIQLVNLSAAQVNAIPDSGQRATVHTIDDARIHDPWGYVSYRRDSHGHAGDRAFTFASTPGGRVWNTAEWSMSQAAGVHRVKVFVPTKDAHANVNYYVYDGSRHIATVRVNQNAIYGWTTLGTWNFTTTNPRVVLHDNQATVRNHLIGFDAVQVVPTR